jgi:16S rRNA (guanine966-N2)-methyltransferase
MSVLQHDIPGARVLDLFAGSGALGLEALSRGAEHVTFVENGAAALRTLQGNIDLLQARARVDVLRTDAIRYVGGLLPHAFDIALADPPYDSDAGRRTVEAFGSVPFARILCVEHDAATTLSDAPEVETRRYGDIAITFLTAPA